MEKLYKCDTRNVRFFNNQIENLKGISSILTYFNGLENEKWNSRTFKNEWPPFCVVDKGDYTNCKPGVKTYSIQ